MTDATAAQAKPEYVRYCCRCREPLPERRLKRQNAFFCSSECSRLDRIARRQVKAEKACRLCGRPVLRRRPNRDDGGVMRGAHAAAQDGPTVNIAEDTAAATE